MWVEEIPNGKFKFCERYKDPLSGKQKRVSVTMLKNTPQTRKQAQVILQGKIDEKLHTASTVSITFHQVANEFWERYITRIRPQTADTMRAPFGFILNYIPSDALIDKITVRMLQELIDSVEGKGKVKLVKTLLNQIYDEAVQFEYVVDNLAKRIKMPRQIKTIEDVEKAQNKYLTEEELKTIIAELSKTKAGKPYALACEFMALNGCRAGELFALTTDKLDIENKTIRIDVSRYRQRIGLPKTTSSIRTVKLSNREIEILSGLKPAKDGTLFTSNNGSALELNAFNAILKTACLKAGIDKPVSTHYFRHTLVSRLAERGVPLKAIMDRVGHSNSKITYEIYTHATEKMKMDVVDILNGLPL